MQFINGLIYKWNKNYKKLILMKNQKKSRSSIFKPKRFKRNRIQKEYLTKVSVRRLRKIIFHC